MTLPRPYYTHEDAGNEFGYHPATDVTGPAHDAVRQACAALAHRLIDLLPEGPRKTEAIGHLRSAMWAANSAIATRGAQDGIWQDEMRRLAPHPRLVLEGSDRPSAAEAAEMIFEALGTASVCWLKVDDRGLVVAGGPGAMGPLVFDSSEAASVGRDLMEALRYELPPGYQDGQDIPTALPTGQHHPMDRPATEPEPGQVSAEADLNAPKRLDR